MKDIVWQIISTTADMIVKNPNDQQAREMFEKALKLHGKLFGVNM